MKKNILTFFFTTLIVFTFTSCEEALEVEVSDAFNETSLFSDPELMERLVFTAYNSTESWGLNKLQWWSRRINIENASFEAKFNFQNRDLYRVRAGWNPSNIGLFKEKWETYWEYIRATNEFLDRVDNSEAMKNFPDRVNILKAEMRFLRANLYSKLIKFFGGVPLIKKAESLGASFDIPRNSYEECVNFIVQELDAAAAVLPETRPTGEFGRATKLAALAVKSRTLLYAASRLHDSSTLPSGPLYDYNSNTKWQDASNAAKAVLDLVSNRELKSVTNAAGYQQLFLDPTNEDIIFARPFGTTFYNFGTDANSLWQLSQVPNGYDGWALSSPTHNFALQFNMADGTTTSETGTTFDANNPNTNREMRYYADLLFQGASFRGRNIDYALSESTSTPPVPAHGLDSPQGLGNTQHSSKTGYNIRKFNDESVGLKVATNRPYILYRLAEMYLNYAEAEYHVGNEATARMALNKVSTRALQPAITASGNALLEAIKRERRVELCFEGHNFFDERRWMNEAHLGFDIKGLTWKKATDGTVSFTESTVVTRPWFARQYYLPILQTEIDKAPAMLQNDGY